MEGLQKKVKRFFWHRCNQYHLVETLTPWGQNKEEWVLLRKEIPCRLVEKSKKEEKKGELCSLWRMQGKVLLPKEIVLETGDLLEISGFFGKPVWMTAKNVGINYLTHQEVSVEERGERIG